MQISSHHIAEFQSIYKEQFGITLSIQDAHSKVLRAIRLIQLLYHPMTHDELNQIKSEVESIRSRLKSKLLYTRNIRPT